MKASLRYAILERDRFACFYCGRGAPDVPLHVDHIKARSAGGADSSSNLITACQDCSLGKGAGPAVDAAIAYAIAKDVEVNLSRLGDWRRFHPNFRLPAYDAFISWLANDLPSPFTTTPGDWFDALAARGTLAVFREFLRVCRAVESTA